MLEANQQAIVSAVNNSIASMFNDLCACLGLVITKNAQGQVSYIIPKSKDPNHGGILEKVFIQLGNLNKLVADKPAIYLPGGRQ